MSVPTPPTELGSVAVFIITVLLTAVVSLWTLLMREMAGRRADVDRYKEAEATAVGDTRASYNVVLEQYERRCDKQRQQDKENQREIVALITSNLEKRDVLLADLTSAVRQLAQST